MQIMYNTFKSSRVWLLILGCMASAMLPSISIAQTDVTGTIVEEVWTQSGSPYMVRGDIQVAVECPL